MHARDQECIETGAYPEFWIACRNNHHLRRKQSAFCSDCICLLKLKGTQMLDNVENIDTRSIVGFIEESNVTVDSMSVTVKH